MKIKKKIITMFVIFILFAIFCFWQNYSLVVTDYTYSSTEIPSSFDGYRIVQISDLHNKNFGKQPNCLVKKIQKLKPDMIVVTGDIVDSNHTDIETSIAFLEEAVKLAPCYYINGNHELWLEESVKNDLMSQINDTGTVILNDRIIDVIEDDNSKESITLVGLDDASLLDDTLHSLTNDIKNDEFVLLLAHEPQNLMIYSKENVDLILSGHAHGGQIRFPWIGGFVAPDQGFFPKYTEGRHEENNVSVIISRGIGNSIIPIRIFNRPEIVCVELTMKADK